MIHPRHLFDEYGQGHVFRFFDDLPPEQQDELTRQATSIDLDEIKHLVETLVKNPKETDAASQDIEPADYIPISARNQEPMQW